MTLEVAGPSAGDRVLGGSSAARKRPRLGFVGVGWIGKHRMESVRDSGCGEVAALVEPDPDMCALACDSAPQARVVDDLEDLWSLGLDGLVIATPSALHATQSIAALDHGLAVFCQKPLGRTAAETELVVEAARQRGQLLAVDFSYRYTEAMRGLRALVQGGELGEVFAVDLVFHNGYGPDKAWFYDRALSGGGCLMDLGIHLVDALLWVMNWPRVTQVAGRAYRDGKLLHAGDPGAVRNHVEDYAVARLDLATGAVAQLACSWRLAVGRDAMIGMHVYGTRGGAAVMNVDGSFFDFTLDHHVGTSCQRLVAPPDAWGGRAITDFVRRLATKPGFDAQAEELVRVARVLEAIQAHCA